ncbi:AMP-binding protein [Leptospira kemamanensis]|uniref:AMP-binding protein n=1 Tax=Leptospira kemamanensis TaxID=2484942 RepID=UPI001FC9A391|nr:AMP-binding protein [Leptospira kemamanensis]
MDRNRTPLMKEEWNLELEKMTGSPFAPKWNAIIGDRIGEEEFLFVTSFQKDLLHAKEHSLYQTKGTILPFIESYLNTSDFFKKQLQGIPWKQNFELIPFMNRDDLQTKITEIIPNDVNLKEIVINPTSGTTGKPILAPNHSKAIGCYVPLIEFSVERFGVRPIHSPKSTFAIQLCYQENTIVYATCHSLAGGSKFAKINIHPNGWKKPSDLQNFLTESSPQILTGDPYAFESAMQMGIHYKPEAIHSTALELTPALRTRLSAYFQCPVINFYSLNETGPIAYSCPNEPEWMHLLPHDLYVEIISNTTGNPVPTGNVGEIVLTGGRNPFIPLLRYQTGDQGEIQYGPCVCGDHFPRLRLLSGRKPVYFQKQNGEIVNPIDVARILRKNPIIYQFQVEQTNANEWVCRLSLEETTRGNESIWENEKKAIQVELTSLFGEGSVVHIHTDFPLDGKKQIAFLNSYQRKKEQEAKS